MIRRRRKGKIDKKEKKTMSRISKFIKRKKGREKKKRRNGTRKGNRRIKIGKKFQLGT